MENSTSCSSSSSPLTRRVRQSSQWRQRSRVSVTSLVAPQDSQRTASGTVSISSAAPAAGVPRLLTGKAFLSSAISTPASGPPTRRIRLTARATSSRQSESSCMGFRLAVGYEAAEQGQRLARITRIEPLYRIAHVHEHVIAGRDVAVLQQEQAYLALDTTGLAVRTVAVDGGDLHGYAEAHTRCRPR